ncbi:hypothetical protein MKSMC1_29690 [Mycobacterium kansasii]|nr:hypothetical protein MKSMC1_29690 [Mycobacterium kansasii]
MFPGGFGTLDELFEALTLIQTEKIRRFPVVLTGSQHWGGLERWISQQLLEPEMVSSDDVQLLTLADDPTRLPSSSRTGVDADTYADVRPVRCEVMCDVHTNAAMPRCCTRDSTD